MISRLKKRSGNITENMSDSAVNADVMRIRYVHVLSIVETECDNLLQQIDTSHIMSKEKVIKCRNAVYKYFFLYYNKTMDDKSPQHMKTGGPAEAS